MNLAGIRVLMTVISASIGACFVLIAWFSIKAAVKAFVLLPICQMLPMGSGWLTSKRMEPALKYFPPERLMLTSECGFGHVPLDITLSKLRALTSACETFRQQ